MSREYTRFSDFIRMPKLWQLFLKAPSLDQFLEIHIVKILDGYGIEVAIPSIANPTCTSHVVIPRGAERFVNEIHDHKEELRSSNELLTELLKDQ